MAQFGKRNPLRKSKLTVAKSQARTSQTTTQDQILAGNNSFGQTPTDGQFPHAGVILDAAGNLYGTTPLGGADSSGTVFEISPADIESILHSFASPSTTDGNTPYAGLIRDPAGNLYGTTELGGAFAQGTVYKLTRGGKEDVLYSFGITSTDGAFPVAGLLRDAAGNLYGTTETGGNPPDSSAGTVFKLDPTGMETLLFSFDAFGTTGYCPEAGLIEDTKGNFYGTTALGGLHDGGVVFKVSPTGQESVFHRFTGPPNDGYKPVGGLIRDKAGNLYGTTSLGGSGNCGIVFKIAP